ncbi:hypothetical protein, partial [Hydrogenimonas sp.]
DEILLPEESFPIRIGDEILLAGDKDGFTDVEYIMENINELCYVLTGKECQLSIVNKMLFGGESR